MIRVAFLLCLSALPLQAQDFRGLLPGMETQELARLGEPFDLQSQDGFTVARYPLPFERTLEVLHTDGAIVSIALGALASTRMQPPPSDGLQIGETQLSEAITLAGSDGFAFEVIQSLPELPPSGWSLSYPVAEFPDLVLTLTFYGRLNPDVDADDINGAQDMPQDATLITATLIDPSIIARYPVLVDLQQNVPPDAMPLAVSLTDAFPLIELPQ